MRLDETYRKKIAEQLGRPVPPPTDESFWNLLDKLRATDPELATELEENVIFDDLGDPEREAQRADARAVAFRMGYRRLFYRFDEVRQTWHLHRGKLLAWGVGGFLAFFLPAFFYRPEPQVASAQNIASATVSGSSMSGGAIAEAPKIPKAPKLPIPEALIIEKPPESEAPAAAPLVAQPAPAPAVPLTQPQVPTTSEPRSLSAYSKAAWENVRTLGAYQRGGQAAGAAQAGSTDPFADGSSSVQTSRMSAFQNQPQAATEPKGLSAYAKETDLTAKPLRTPVEPGSQSGGATPAGNADPLFKGQTVETEYVEVSAAGTQAADPFSASPPPGQPVEAPAATEAPPELMSERYNTGDMVEAELVVGLIALGQEPLPVIARGRDGSVWQGQAVLGASGRVDITFGGAARDSGSQSLEAIALADDGYAGVPAAIKETTPALASDLARGALRGASEFVEGLRDQSSVTLSNGAAVVSRDAPPLDASVLGSVARLFTPPEGEDQQALARLAEVPSGTKIQIMVLGSAP